MVAHKRPLLKSWRMEKSDVCIELERSYAARLAQRLRVLRDERNVRQEYVAYRAGISTFTYQKFEKGESNPGKPMNPRLSTLIALTQAFGLEPWELIRFDE